MLHPSTTTPGVSNTRGAAGVPLYSGSSNFFGDENEYTWCLMLSRLGKFTVVAASTASTYGMNSCFHWSITARPRAAADAAPGGETRYTTASSTGLPLSSLTTASIAGLAAAAGPAPG